MSSFVSDVNIMAGLTTLHICGLIILSTSSVTLAGKPIISSIQHETDPTGILYSNSEFVMCTGILGMLFEHNCEKRYKCIVVQIRPFYLR